MCGPKTNFPNVWHFSIFKNFVHSSIFYQLPEFCPWETLRQSAPMEWDVVALLKKNTSNIIGKKKIHFMNLSVLCTFCYFFSDIRQFSDLSNRTVLETNNPTTLGFGSRSFLSGNIENSKNIGSLKSKPKIPTSALTHNL